MNGPGDARTDGVLNHVIVSREFPPADYSAGGIGTYVANMAHLLAASGDVVHVIGQQWRGAPLATEVLCDGRLIVHRLPIDRPVSFGARHSTQADIDVLRDSPHAVQAWGLNVAILLEHLIDSQPIDVIEAQEWEAPLYFFLMRRALGLGSSQRPPCVIHLHSPSESVWRANDWNLWNRSLQYVHRQEQYCLLAADALLSPSEFLKQDVIRQYGIQPELITTIPYPMGRLSEATSNVAEPLRSKDLEMSVLYVGRIEPRKGVIEYTDAAVAVARTHPDIRFVYVGSDVLSPEGVSTYAHVLNRIPKHLRHQFVFTGQISRAELYAYFAAARFAVVPSRWENFPNSCMEAMSYGVAVLVSPNGGMAELVVDGVSGWIAPSPSAVELEVTLRRAINTSDATRASMSAAARTAVNAMCNNTIITERHRAFKRELSAAERITKTNETPSPVINDAELYEVTVAPGVTVDPDAVERVATLLSANPDIGVVTGWVHARAGQSRAPLSPSFPHQWCANDVWPVAILRSSAVRQAGAVPTDIPEPYATWYLVNAILTKGWLGVSVPFVIAALAKNGAYSNPDVEGDLAHAMRERMRRDFPAALTPDVVRIVTSYEAHRSIYPGQSGQSDRWTGIPLQAIWQLPTPEKFGLLKEAVKNPSRLLGWLRTQFARRWRTP